MNPEEQIKIRSNNTCELCGSTEGLSIYRIPPPQSLNTDDIILVCSVCLQQLEKRTELDPKHWLILKEVMWSEIPAVQIVAWRLLNRLKNETWAADALDMLYLDEDTLARAKASNDHLEDENDAMHRDSNGVLLQSGDTIVLTKSLDVKGSQLNAKIGTVVKNIRLVTENTEQIEGKIDGQTIVILTKYTRKS